ncbi:hypothetical protein BCR34DRAFT_571398 [Clohesyomyces aquaticus]|uniref:Ketoreductase domain-containing protein n=1 Tax=Clohesyomyces aquaticus TaxID=1231657 RepID=A0A1Y1Z7Z9_9PLEO|nr:hypothetical protein BCR34DRAFT_571398 [Clohesyomyces aquaticus]
MADQAPDPNMFTLPFQLTKKMRRDVYPAVDPMQPELAAVAKGKVVMIVGAGGGIGFAVAKAWSLTSAKGIVLVGRNVSALESTARDIGAESKVPILIVDGDITSAESVASIFTKAIDKFGTVDTVVKAAGRSELAVAPVGQIEAESWWPNFEILVKGTFNLVSALSKATTAAGPNKTGTFVNVVSAAAAAARPGMSSYGIAQLAATRLGEFVDLDCPHIRSFSLHPGIVAVENNRGGVVEMFTPFAKDKAMLTGGISLWLQKPEADFLRGGFFSVNWDVEEMLAHKEEIVEKRLVKLGFVGAELGPEGHPWGT